MSKCLGVFFVLKWAIFTVERYFSSSKWIMTMILLMAMLIFYKYSKSYAKFRISLEMMRIWWWCALVHYAAVSDAIFFIILNLFGFHLYLISIMKNVTVICMNYVRFLVIICYLYVTLRKTSTLYRQYHKDISLNSLLCIYSLLICSFLMGTHGYWMK